METPPEIIKQMKKMMLNFYGKAFFDKYLRGSWTESYRLRNTYKSIKIVLDSVSFR